MLIKNYFDYKNYKNILEFIPNDNRHLYEYYYDETIPLIKTIKDFCIKNNEKRFIISLSGGVDSMVLISIINYIGYEVIGVHINYNNRPETNEEQDFLEKWCIYNGIKLYVKTIKDIKRATTKRSDYEIITKKIRFDFYKEIMKKESINQILLGHHKDDIIENIFANVCRGRNILDLAVIRKTCTNEDVNIGRPMLEFYKTIIYDFANNYQVPYFKDTTPQWSVRGKYRNQITPLLEDTFNNIKENLIVLSNQSDDWNDLVQMTIIDPFMKMVKYNEFSSEFNVENYNNYPMVFWSTIFSKIFFYYGKSCPSRKAILVFMNNIKIKNVSYISLSNSCICTNKNNNITIEFKQITITIK